MNTDNIFCFAMYLMLLSVDIRVYLWFILPFFVSAGDPTGDPE